MSVLEPVELTHVSREVNQVADTMVKEGAKQMNPGNTTFFVSVPMFVKNQYEANAIGTCYARKTSTNVLSYVGRDVTQLNSEGANLLAKTMCLLIKY